MLLLEATGYLTQEADPGGIAFVDSVEFVSLLDGMGKVYVQQV